MRKNLSFLLFLLFISNPIWANQSQIFEVLRVNGLPVAESLDGTKRYELIPYDTFMENLEKVKMFDIEHGKLIRPLSITAPNSYSLATYQTGIRDQAGRGSCWAFGGIAALEAYYKRNYNKTLNLSEQYLFHVAKAGELYTDYLTTPTQHENNSSFWGFQGNSGIVKHMTRAAVPKENYAPYMTNAQMVALKNQIPASGNLDWDSNQEELDAFEWDTRHIPLSARWQARYFVKTWETVHVGDRNTLNSRLEQIISTKREVIGDFNLKWKWDAANNRYDWDPNANNAGHVMLIIGYNRSQGYFLLKNSWGGNSYVKVSYNFMKNGYQWGHIIKGATNPNNPPRQIKAAWLGNWNMDHDGWRGKMVFRRFTDFRNNNANAATKLGNYYRSGKRYDVNGYFAQNGQCMYFHIANTTSRVKPGSSTGPKYEACIFSWDLNNAAGKTASGYGAILSRNYIPYKYGNNFNLNKWKGTWKMNHDGWKGTLKITGFSAPSSGKVTMYATYKAYNGVYKPVTGTIYTSKPHQLIMKITFSSSQKQNFYLFFHTWTEKTFSGNTYWSGKKYGVLAYKQ